MDKNMKNQGSLENKKSLVLQGVIVSPSFNKTITVKVERTYRHQTYGKVVRKYKTYKVHDPESIGSVGKMVVIKQVAPISKTKKMILSKVFGE